MRLDRASILVARRTNSENFVFEVFGNLTNRVFSGFTEPILGRFLAQGVLPGAGPGAGPGALPGPGPGIGPIGARQILNKHGF